MKYMRDESKITEKQRIIQARLLYRKMIFFCETVFVGLTINY